MQWVGDKRYLLSDGTRGRAFIDRHRWGYLVTVFVSADHQDADGIRSISKTFDNIHKARAWAEGAAEAFVYVNQCEATMTRQAIETLEALETARSKPDPIPEVEAHQGLPHRDPKPTNRSV